MSTQRIYQLLISFVILAVIAFVSERSHVLASVVSVMPLNVTIVQLAGQLTIMVRSRHF